MSEHPVQILCLWHRFVVKSHLTALVSPTVLTAAPCPLLITPHSLPKCLPHRLPTIPISTWSLQWHQRGLSHVLFIVPAMELFKRLSFSLPTLFSASNGYAESGGLPFQLNISFSCLVISHWKNWFPPPGNARRERKIFNFSLGMRLMQTPRECIDKKCKNCGSVIWEMIHKMGKVTQLTVSVFNKYGHRCNRNSVA